MAYDLTIKYNGTQISSASNVDSSAIVYNGTTLVNSFTGTKTLSCAGKLMNGTLVVGPKTLACAGKLMSGNINVTSAQASVTKVITFNSSSDLTDNFTVRYGGSSGIAEVTGGYLHLGAASTDNWAYVTRSYSTTCPTSVEIYERIDGSTNDFVTNQYGVGLGTGKGITFYTSHKSSGWTSYLPFPSYTNNSLIAYNSTIYYSSSPLSYGTMYTIKFVNTGTSIEVYLNGTKLATIPETTTITSLTLNPCSGWWQTYWNGYIDTVTEVYN